MGKTVRRVPERSSYLYIKDMLKSGITDEEVGFLLHGHPENNKSIREKERKAGLEILKEIFRRYGANDGSPEDLVLFRECLLLTDPLEKEGTSRNRYFGKTVFYILNELDHGKPAFFLSLKGKRLEIPVLKGEGAPEILRSEQQRHRIRSEEDETYRARTEEERAGQPELS